MPFNRLTFIDNIEPKSSLLAKSCPVCKKSFTTADTTQSHRIGSLYHTVHKGCLASHQCPICKKEIVIYKKKELPATGVVIKVIVVSFAVMFGSLLWCAAHGRRETPGNLAMLIGSGAIGLAGLFVASILESVEGTVTTGDCDY